MNGFRAASAFVCSAFPAALGVAPLLAVGATAEKVKAALDAYESNVTGQNEQLMAMRIAEIEAILELPEDRSPALHALAEKAQEEALAAWRRRAEKELKDSSISDQQLQQGASVDPEPEDLPDVQPAWKDGLAKVLTAGEHQRLEDRRVERQARRTRSLAELFLLFVDEKVALSAEQRTRLLPLAERLVPKFREMTPADVEQDEDLFNPAVLLSAGKEAPEKEVRAILIDAQWERWKKTCVPPGNEATLDINGNIVNVIPGLVPPGFAALPNSASPAAGGAAEPVEQTLSKFMAAQAIRHRQQLLTPLLLRIEEAARVAHLSPEVCARLQTAARGAAEKALQKWAPQFQQFIRNNLQEITPENVSQQLARLGNPAAFQSPETGPPKPSLFDKSLQAELTPAQQARWQKEVDARRAFRSQAIIRAILTSFDRLVPLRPEQFAKVTAMVTVLLTDYREELETAYSSEQAPWFMQSEMRSAPLAGLNPAEMQALLGKTRWELWTKTEEYTDAKSSWANLKESHQNRRR